jgi:misacylated tRNA(Ala) deacylase
VTPTEELYAVDAYRREFEAATTGTDPDGVRLALDRTAFYPGGGGQPPDVGELVVGEDRLAVVRVAGPRRRGVARGGGGVEI